MTTAEDLGTQGELPTHPQLLDWLAVEFMDSGWSRKHLLRLIVNSATWQQSSAAAAEQYELDPDNRLLWRVSKRRLEAEAIRDSMLAVSGEPFDSSDHLFEIKWDGIRSLACVQRKALRLWGRSQAG